jgi:hypothetical protein
VNDATQLFQLTAEGTVVPGLKVQGVLRTIAAVKM